MQGLRLIWLVPCALKDISLGVLAKFHFGYFILLVQIPLAVLNVYNLSL